VNASPPLRFGLIFILLFAILAGAFEASRGTALERVMVVDLVIVPTAQVLNAITPDEPVELHGRALVSGAARLNVTRGCEGVELLLLLAAAIGAFPASLWHRLRGLLLGGLLAYALSIGRLVALDLVLRYAPGGWQAMHGLIMPLAPVIILSCYFLHWSGVAVAGAGAAAQAHQSHAT